MCAPKLDCDRQLQSTWSTLTASLIIGAFAFSTIRKALSVAVPFSLLTKQEIGFISSNFSIGYGCSKLIGGVLSDIMSPRLLFTLGLLIGSLINIVFSYISNTRWYCAAWLLSGILQGIGNPAMSKLVLHEYDSKNAGFIWSLLTCAGNVGYMISPFLLLSMATIDWKMPFLVTGWMGVLAVVCIHCNFCYQSFQTINNIDDQDCSHNVYLNKNNDSKEEKKSAQKSNASLQYNTNYTSLLFLMASNFLTVFTLKTMADWSGLYFMESHNVSASNSAELMLWSEIGGLVGTFLVGVVATKCNGNKSFSCLLFAVTCFVSLLLLHTFLARVQDLKNFCRQEEHSSIRNNSCYDSGSIYSRWDYIIIRLLLFFAGLGVNGPKTLLIVTIQEISNPAVSGTVAGIAGLIGQLGASCAGIGVGYFLETQGWNDFLLVMAMPTCLTAVCLTYPSFTIR